MLMHTRWHQEDLAGRLLNEMDSGEGGKWRVIWRPANATDNDGIRKEGMRSALRGTTSRPSGRSKQLRGRASGQRLVSRIQRSRAGRSSRKKGGSAKSSCRGPCTAASTGIPLRR